jgi:hypothetical protein
MKRWSRLVTTFAVVAAMGLLRDIGERAAPQQPMSIR